MPINEIFFQPGTNSLQAAYRPVILNVNVDGIPVPPVVYCDIYFNGVYYKTLSKTAPFKIKVFDSDWQFDIQDAAQEYLGKFLADNGGIAIVDVSAIMLMAVCKLRSSNFDGNGFIQPEGTPPVQGTGNTAPVPGTGTSSNTFYIVNCTLQHDDNQSLSAHLGSYKTGNWNANCYPLTHRPAVYHVGRHVSDYFPAIIDDSLCLSQLVLKYKFKGQNLIRQAASPIISFCNGVITAVTVIQASGTANATISWTATGNITAYYYRVDGVVWIFTTNTSVNVTGLSIGDHFVDVAAVCQCGQGPIFNQSFTIADPAVFICTATVTALAASQTNDGEADVSFTSGGDHWTYSVDGGTTVPITSHSFHLTGLTIGTHSVNVQSYCSNDVAGGSQTISFNIVPIPSITKIAEFSVVGIRNQTFQIGPNVTDGNTFNLVIYGVTTTVIASSDIPSSIATKLKNAINATSEGSWDAASLAPASGTFGFPPFANATGDQIQISMDAPNSFSYYATII